MAFDLLKLLKHSSLYISGSLNDPIQHLTANTKALRSGSVYFARKGVTRDGHEFLPEALKVPGLAGIVAERWESESPPPVPLVLVRDSTLAMALALKAQYGHPTGDALTVAVTGTNGKTTTTFLVETLLREMGHRPVRSGTIEIAFEGERLASDLTTPDFSVLLEVFAEARKKGATSFVFEASSHALDQRRLLGLDLDVAIFTNLTPEHLDYHHSMEAYFEAKKKLFSDLLANSSKQKKMAIFPDDGKYGSRLIKEFQYETRFEKVVWGRGPGVDVRLVKFSTDADGSELVVQTKRWGEAKFRAQLVGAFNMENIMGVVALGEGLSLSQETVARAIEATQPVPGRIEVVKRPSAAKGRVFVDYAHTADALENVLQTLRPLTQKKLKIVFGCGGDRDKSKRPKMAEVAELYADEIFLTSDNPRTEDPDAIISQVMKGFQRVKPLMVEADRRRAIHQALRTLDEGDVLLIAGKGHETYQILGTKKIPFDDREVTRDFDQGREVL